MKTLFLGTPSVAVPYLELVHAQSDLRAVLTKPDEPAGRGYTLQSSAVKQKALQLGLPILQPETLKAPQLLEQVVAFGADVGFVVAYGKILPDTFLNLPKLGFINVHFSLLPAYRGAAPVQRAVMAGETQTGVTLFWLDPGLDTGPIFLQKSLDIRPGADAQEVRTQLNELGLVALREVMESLKRGEMVRRAQQGDASFAPPLKKEEGLIRWEQSATQIVNLIRGTVPWPGAYTWISIHGKALRLKILKACPVANPVAGSQPGVVVSLVPSQGFVVQSGDQSVEVLTVQPEGKKAMSAWAFWQGARLNLGEKLNSHENN